MVTQDFLIVPAAGVSNDRDYTLYRVFPTNEQYQQTSSILGRCIRARSYFAFRRKCRLFHRQTFLTNGNWMAGLQPSLKLAPTCARSNDSVSRSC